ncbi:NADH-quinone oxidoreductase subunit C [Actinotalea ferrariae]|uniref:NADH-quinone oxidoreductase subunit C n=1 Tax=Actinotalea ferrariae TaxID=1386098 RepID=UPI001C8B7D18|nr:NADH-quinone oxidoreductase subunit C [Actinotalea ferrariae]MBX9243255.1 NADH-quinone oxidoreductase subunit C [Actinotalea ferrariae]
MSETPKDQHVTGDTASAQAGASQVAKDTAAGLKGTPVVGTESRETPQKATETAQEGAGQNLPAPAGPATPQLEIIAVREGMFGAGDGGDTSGFGGLVRTIAMPGPSERPYGGWFDEVVDILAEVLGEGGTPFDAAIEKVVVDREELTLYVRREHVVTVCRALRDDQDLRFELGLGVSGVHYPFDTGRELHAVYQLRSITHGRALRLEVAVSETDPHIPSSVAVYPGHDWHERETWDFFGIVFDGHPGLARIEMPDDWPGHPQRKDYPLGGIPVEYKGASIPPPDERRSYS